LAPTAAGQDPTIADTLELALAPTVTAPDRARAEVTAWLAGTGHDGNLIDDVRLLVSELVTNCVRHANLSTEQPVRLTATLHAAILRLEVHDEGLFGTVARRPPRPFAESGFGLNLVARLAEDWGVERNSGGTTVWLELAAGA
jgi:anti-sigma regulatory factor (Ser/Thr protein kinase)